jgi:hypothetical protein
VLLVRDLLDQAVLDRDGEAAGRVDDLLIAVEGDDVFLDAILCGGGIVADDLGVVGRLCEAGARSVRRRSLRRGKFAWTEVEDVAEHAVTVTAARPTVGAGAARSGLRLRTLRRMPVRTSDGIVLHVLDVRVADPSPPERPRVLGLVVRRRNLGVWPISLRPRQIAAPSDWRFAPIGDVRFGEAGLVVAGAYGDLPAAPNAVVSPPPGRTPRAAT